MATAQVSISMPPRLAEEVRMLRESGDLHDSVSAICQRALRAAVAEARAARREREQEERTR